MLKNHIKYIDSLVSVNKHANESTLARINQAHDQLRQYVERINVDLFPLLDDPVQEKDVNEFFRKSNQYLESGQSSLAAAQLLVQKYIDERAARRLDEAQKLQELRKANPTASGGSSSGSTPKTKAVDALKPEKLKHTHTPAEFRAFEEAFEVYFEDSNIEMTGIKSQRQYLLQLLDTELQRYLKQKIEDETPVFPLENVEDAPISCFDLLKKYMLDSFPVLVRRIDYFKVNQRGDESITKFITQLDASDQEANIADMNYDHIRTH